MSHRTAYLAIWFFMACLTATFDGRPQAAEPDRAPRGGSHIEVDRDPDGWVAAVRIKARDGRIAWGDVWRALALVGGLDEAALGDATNEGALDVEGPRARMVLGAVQAALPRGIRLDVVSARATGEEAELVVTLDREALTDSRRQWKNRLRRAISRRHPRRRDYGLKLDEGWEKTPADLDLVLAIHGLHSISQSVEPLLADARREGLPCGVFEYPNDQPVAESAQLLSSELRALSQQYPGRGVSLLAHSMGGLVARAALEAPVRADQAGGADDPPEASPRWLPVDNVRRLIMIATPNHGSELARYVRGGDVLEHLLHPSRREGVGFLYGVVEDGLGEAAFDLTPQSLFLRELNSRRRKAGVRYALILGDRAPLTLEDLQRLREKGAAAEERSRVARMIGPRADAWLEQLDEVVDGRGDGVVAVRRGRLDGVDDTIVLHFGHLEVLAEDPQGDARKVRDIVLQRLQAGKS